MRLKNTTTQQQRSRRLAHTQLTGNWLGAPPEEREQKVLDILCIHLSACPLLESADTPRP